MKKWEFVQRIQWPSLGVSSLLPTGQNPQNGVLGTVPHVLANTRPSLTLGGAQIGIASDAGLRDVEEAFYLTVSHRKSLTSARPIAHPSPGMIGLQS
jgi:hypothetical protein